MSGPYRTPLEVDSALLPVIVYEQRDPFPEPRIGMRVTIPGLDGTWVVHSRTQYRKEHPTAPGVWVYNDKGFRARLNRGDHFEVVEAESARNWQVDHELFALDDLVRR